MNYYPNNYYNSYSYANSYQPQSNQVTIPSLQGKVVDSIDMVKVNEVPFGGFGVFPKGDLSEVYIKSWNANGTTQIHTYKPVVVEEPVKTDNKNELLEKITALNEKLDKIMAAGPVQPVSNQAPAAKEEKINAY